MADWTLKRFWNLAAVTPDQGGFCVELDQRRVKTPAKNTLVVPTQSLAEAVCREWNEVEEKIDPNQMPFTRSANAAIDKTHSNHAEVVDMIAAYGDADLICYRATEPSALVDRQAQAWDPMLAWAKEELGIDLVTHAGVMHLPQEARNLAILHKHTAQLDAFALTAFHDLVSLSGSLILGFATLRSAYRATQIWDLSRLDEIWQQEQWGTDEEAETTASLKREAFLHAKMFYDLSQPTP